VEGGRRCEEKNKMKVNVRKDKRCVRQTDVVASGRGELKTCNTAQLPGGAGGGERLEQ